MARDHGPTILTPQTSLESVSSNEVLDNETETSPWSRLRQRLQEVTVRTRHIRRPSKKYGSLIKLAGEERQIVHQSRRFLSQTLLHSTENSQDAGLWREVRMLEERVEALENMLEVNRENMIKTEEKYISLQREVEMLLGKQLQKQPPDAFIVPDQDLFKEKMSRCFEQIRNGEYTLKHVEAETSNRTDEGAAKSRHKRKCAGCGKSTF